MSTEDLPYTTGAPAQPPETTGDIDNNNVSLLRKHLKDIDVLIAEYNSLDKIDTFKPPLTQQQKAALYDQMDNNKKFVMLLRRIREETADKIKELKNG